MLFCCISHVLDDMRNTSKKETLSSFFVHETLQQYSIKYLGMLGVINPVLSKRFCHRVGHVIPPLRKKTLSDFPSSLVEKYELALERHVHAFVNQVALKPNSSFYQSSVWKHCNRCRQVRRVAKNICLAILSSIKTAV